MKDLIVQLFTESGHTDSHKKYRIQQELARIDLELSKAHAFYRRKKAQLTKKKDDLKRSLESLG